MTSDYEELEALLLGLLTEVAPLLNQTATAQARDFIDAKEYGLALEWVIDAFHDEKMVIPEVALAIMSKAARMMDNKADTATPMTCAEITIDHRDGTDSVRTIAALEAVLVASKRGTNDFWISGTERFPALAILVRDDRACLHYFPEEGHPGYQSVSDEPSRSPQERFVSSTGETIEVPGRAVVSVAGALGAAREFFGSRSRPSTLRWQEL